MRRSLILLSVFSMAWCAAASGQDASAGNLVKNPSFEDRSGPRKPYPAEPWGYGDLDGVARSPFAHWGYSGFWDGGDYDVKLGRGRTGKLCARLVCRKRGRGGVCTDEIRVTPGTRLRFRGFFKGVDAKGNCAVNFEGDPGDGWAQIPLPDKADYDWTEVTGEVTVKPPSGKRKPGDDGKVRIHVFIYTRAYGELWIDDVTLTVVGEPE
ncbi:MAG TPA: hypothetical protein VMZ92_13760 [Planctomycetota bacterium]|nr:hypothetical protein [Planctomycetota bacterium]